MEVAKMQGSVHRYVLSIFFIALVTEIKLDFSAKCSKRQQRYLYLDLG